MVDNKERDPQRDGGLTTSETNKDSLPKQGGSGWVSSLPSGGARGGECNLFQPLKRKIIVRFLKIFVLIVRGLLSRADAQ